MGLEDLVLLTSAFPGTLGFDTVYSYNISTANPYTSYDVSFYKNPPTNTLYPGYVPKSIWTPTTWNSKNYQQIWSVNYQGALWATNGITVPLADSNVLFKTISEFIIDTDQFDSLLIREDALKYSYEEVGKRFSLLHKSIV